jgi:hypothetical protein
MKQLIERINAKSARLAALPGFPNERLDAVYRVSIGSWLIERRNIETGEAAIFPLHSRAAVRAFLEAHDQNLERLVRLHIKPKPHPPVSSERLQTNAVTRLKAILETNNIPVVDMQASPHYPSLARVTVKAAYAERLAGLGGIKAQPAKRANGNVTYLVTLKDPPEDGERKEHNPTLFLTAPAEAEGSA